MNHFLGRLSCAIGRRSRRGHPKWCHYRRHRFPWPSDAGLAEGRDIIDVTLGRTPWPPDVWAPLLVLTDSSPWRSKQGTHYMAHLTCQPIGRIQLCVTLKSAHNLDSVGAPTHTLDCLSDCQAKGREISPAQVT